jgi:succinyl-diaminopimelate desuccinylase
MMNMSDISLDGGGLDAVRLAQALIRCPSVTPRDEGALDLVQAVLTDLGFECTRLPFESPGTARVDNLFARIGTGSPHICGAGGPSRTLAGRSFCRDH